MTAHIVLCFFCCPLVPFHRFSPLLFACLPNSPCSLPTSDASSAISGVSLSCFVQLFCPLSPIDADTGLFEVDHRGLKSIQRNVQFFRANQARNLAKLKELAAELAKSGRATALLEVQQDIQQLEEELAALDVMSREVEDEVEREDLSNDNNEDQINDMDVQSAFFDGSAAAAASSSSSSSAPAPTEVEEKKRPEGNGHAKPDPHRWSPLRQRQPSNPVQEMKMFYLKVQKVSLMFR